MVTQYIERGWGAYKNNAAAVVGATIITALVTIGIFLLASLPMLGTVLPYAANPLALLGNLQALGASAAILAAGIVIAVLAGAVLNAGIVRIYADALSGKARLETLFSTARQKFSAAIGATLLIGVILLFAAALMASSQIFLAVLILPFLLLMLLFAFMFQAIVIDDLGAVDAIAKSVAVAKCNFIAVLLLGVIMGVASWLLGQIPVAGQLVNGLVISPVFGIALTALYVEKKDSC
jgi:hypothetical protein